MKPEASIFIACSLDGFIAGPDGNIDWLNKANEVVPAGEDCGFQDFINNIDTLVMGRKTFEQVLTFGTWPYGDLRVVVLSRNDVNIPDDLRKTVSSSSDSPKELSRYLASIGAQQLYIDGGFTIQSWLQAGLINKLIITFVPVLLGSGIPLIGELDREINLKHIHTQTYDFGFIQVTYDIIKGDHT